MTPNDHADPGRYWRTELAAIAGGFVPTRNAPGTLRRDDPGPYDGFWRALGAKSKWDLPIGIWRVEGESMFLLQIGRQAPVLVDEQSDQWLRFVSGWFTSCAAVRMANWKLALETGYWEDGRPSRPPVEVTDPQAFAAHLVERRDAEMVSFLASRAKWYAMGKQQAPGIKFTVISDKETT